MSTRRRIWDPRIREQVVATGNADLFLELDIPPATIATWLRRGQPDIVWLNDTKEVAAELRMQVAHLEERVKMLTALVRLVLTVMHVLDARIDGSRILDAKSKTELLIAVQRAARLWPLKSVLRAIGMASSRHHGWARSASVCQLDDRPSCPAHQPQRLTATEVPKISDMVVATEHRHMSIRGLALYAQRAGRVFAHPGTWGKLIRERGWRRPRLRVYPAKPRVGVQAVRPNEMWHIDASILRLLDGSKVYMHAVIDNYHRRCSPADGLLRYGAQ